MQLLFIPGRFSIHVKFTEDKHRLSSSRSVHRRVFMALSVSIDIELFVVETPLISR